MKHIFAIGLLLAAAGPAGAEDVREAYREGAIRVGLEHELRTDTFTPEQLPGLRLWLRSDAGVKVDEEGRVSEWADPERGIALAQPTPELRPRLVEQAQNGRLALRLTAPKGDPKFSRLSLAQFPLAGDRISLVIVARADTPPYKDHPGAVGNLVSYGVRHYGSESFRLGAINKPFLEGTPPPSETPRGLPLRDRGFLVLQTDIEPASNRQAVFENGELLGATPRKDAIPASAILELGGFHGAVAEVLVLSRPPDAVTRARLTRYLLDKYGIAADTYVTPLAGLLPFAYYPSENELEVAFDRNSPLLQEYFAQAPRPAATPRITSPGVAYAYYTNIPSANQGATIATEFKDLGKYTPAKTGVSPVASYEPAQAGPLWTRASTTMPVLAIQGFIDAPVTGTYTFSIRYGTHYGTSRLYIADTRVVEKPFTGRGFADLGGAINLQAGKHPFFFVASVPQVLADQPLDQILWTPPGEWYWRPVPAERFSHDPGDADWSEPETAAPDTWTPPAVLNALKAVEVSVVSLADGTVVKRLTLPLDAGGRGQQRFIIPELPDGRYAVDWHVAGQRVRATRTLLRKHFPWENNTLGLEHQVYPPFEEVKVKGRTVSVVDRTYTLNAQGLFDSVISQGRELLAAPMQLVVELEDGERVAWKPAAGWFSRGVKGKAAHPDEAVFETTAEGSGFRVQGSVQIQEDGCARINLTLTPDTRNLKPDTRNLTSIRLAWLEVPYRSDEAPLMAVDNGRNASFGYFGRTPPRPGEWKYQAWSFTWWQPKPGETEARQDGVFWTANDGLPWGGGRSTFYNYIWLGGMERGLCWFGSPGADHAGDGAEPMQELERVGDTIVLRSYLIKQPVRLDEPVRYEFGLQATPTKPMPEDFRRVDLPGPNAVVAIGGYMCASKYPDNADFSLIDLFTQPARTSTAPDEKLKQEIHDWWANRAWQDQVVNYEHPIHTDEQVAAFVNRYLQPGQNRISYIEEHNTFVRQPDWQVFQDEWGTREFNRFQDGDHSLYSGAASYNDFAVYFCNEYLRRGVSLYWDNGGPRRFLTNPRITGFIGEANALWGQRDYYKRVWKRMAALNASGELFRPVYMVGNAQYIVPHITWFSAYFGSEVTGRIDPSRPSRANESAIWDFAKGKGFIMPHSRDLIQAHILNQRAGANTVWGGTLSCVEPKTPRAAMMETGMQLVHETIRPFQAEMRWRGSLDDNPRYFGGLLEDYFAWFGYGRPEVTVHNYWADEPYVRVSDPNIAWIAMEKRAEPGGRESEVRTLLATAKRSEDGTPEPRTLNPALFGLLLLQSYQDDAVAVKVAFPGGGAMMDLLTRELLLPDVDGRIAIPLPEDYGTRLLAVGRNPNALPPTPGPDDLLLGDFELGLPADLTPHPHHAGHLCAIVPDPGRPGNHILQVKRPIYTEHQSAAQMMTDGVISFRFRLPALPAKGGRWVLHYAWHAAKPWPETTQYGGGIVVTGAADATATWTFSLPQAVVNNQAHPFTDIGTNLTDKPLPGRTVDTDWHTLAIETRGGRHVIRFDDQMVFEGSSNLVPAGGFSLAPAYDPYIEIDDLRIQKLH